MNIRILHCAALAAACSLCLTCSASPQKPAPLDTQSLIDQCQRTGQFPTAADCARWATRKQAIEQSACPDKRATTACRSFRELLHDNDAGMMNDFAHQDHVYVCFMPGIDEFFKVTYFGPSSTGFISPTPGQIKAGVPPNALAVAGESDFDYFSKGVRDTDASFHNQGNWIYLPPVQANPDTLRQNLNSRDAYFKGKNIEIAGDEWKLTESYRNDTNALIKHTVTVQLATGRFRQEYAVADSGSVQTQNDGRCLIAP